MLELLDEYEVELQGANAVVIGRSDIVGKPVALLFLQRHATVTICHSRTRISQRRPHGRTCSSLQSAWPGSCTRPW